MQNEANNVNQLRKESGFVVAIAPRVGVYQSRESSKAVCPRPYRQGWMPNCSGALPAPPVRAGTPEQASHPLDAPQTEQVLTHALVAQLLPIVVHADEPAGDVVGLR